MPSRITRRVEAALREDRRGGSDDPLAVAGGVGTKRRLARQGRGRHLRHLVVVGDQALI
jgi:hypothetical protein